MRVVNKPLEWVRPYDANPKLHPPEQVERLATLITEHGWRQPIVTTADGEIIIGHGRYLAAQRLELKKVPVHVADRLTPEQVRALRIADNRIAEDGQWDMSLLGVEVAELIAVDYDVSLTMLSKNQLKQLKDGNAGSKDHTHLGEDEHLVLLECEDEAQAKALYDEMVERGIACRLMS